MASWHRRGYVLLVAWLTAGTAGCAHLPALPAQPWHREYLARRALRFDADPLEDKFRQHWYSARGGADLGFGEPGGGCGCN